MLQFSGRSCPVIVCYVAVTFRISWFDAFKDLYQHGQCWPNLQNAVSLLPCSAYMCICVLMSLQSDAFNVCISVYFTRPACWNHRIVRYTGLSVLYRRHYYQLSPLTLWCITFVHFAFVLLSVSVRICTLAV